jgi:hypothetical protein
LDRRTDRPDGSGGGSPTVVTTRATGDDLIGDEQEAQPNGIVAPPRRSPQKPAAATVGAAKSNGGKDAVRPAAADATIVDGVPALPADTIAASRGTKPNGPVPDRETPAGQADEQTSVDDSPAYGFGAPPSAPAAAGADAAESPIKLSGDDASRTGPSGTGLSSSGSSETGPLGTGSSGRPSSSVPPASADSPSVSTAAFAWEMPDPPPNSPSSPARTFLPSGTIGKGSAAPKAASPASPDKTEAGKAAADMAAAGMAAAGMAAAAEDPVTMRVSGQKGQKKRQSKRSARQAHLTVARVEPWSVMKFSFVVSLVAFVILFVAVFLLYSILSGLGVFDSLQRVVQSITSSQGSAGVNAKAWFSASKVLGYTALLGSLNIVLITAMSTIGSVVYNLTSRLVGGVEVTLRETE